MSYSAYRGLTEQLKSYIDTKEKIMKWILGIAGYAVLAAIVAAIMAFIIR
jgi:hypothetical protein